MSQSAEFINDHTKAVFCVDMAGGTGRYHHGQLEQAAIDGAVEEVETVGVAAARMRRIARRTGVTHAALAHTFGDKTGMFTAAAIEGFRLVARMIDATIDGPNGLARGCQTYVNFAMTHRGHFEVMFRPNLFHVEDADAVAARTAVSDAFHHGARASLGAHRSETVTDVEIHALALASWSTSPGLAALTLSAALPRESNCADADLVAHFASGINLMGKVIQSASPPWTASHFAPDRQG